jgi:hypothetical protein
MQYTPSVEKLWQGDLSERLHGVISFHEEAIPICGLTQSSSPMPTARNIPRAGASLETVSDDS